MNRPAWLQRNPSRRYSSSSYTQSNVPLMISGDVSEVSAVMTTMLVAGAAAGITGWVQVAGLQGTLYPSVAGGLGFTGVLVALLGNLRPLGILLAALFFGALQSGAEGMQAGTGVPSAIAHVFEGMILLAATLILAMRQRKLRRVVVEAS